MNRQAAVSAIQSIFVKYKNIAATDTKLLQSLTDGKLYELFVLSHVLENLRQRGFKLTFQGTTLKFKASPGKIKLSDPHFLVNSPQGPDWHLFVDIEFETLGSTQAQGGHDKSLRHEIDIVVVSVTSGYSRGSAIKSIAMAPREEGNRCRPRQVRTKTCTKQFLRMVRRPRSLRSAGKWRRNWV
jgi:hypothetical protein